MEVTSMGAGTTQGKIEAFNQLLREGIPLAEACRRVGVQLATGNRWIRYVERVKAEATNEQKANEPPQFARLLSESQMALGLAGTRESNGAKVIELEVAGTLVTVRQDFDSEMLIRLVSALRRAI